MPAYVLMKLNTETKAWELDTDIFGPSGPHRSWDSSQSVDKESMLAISEIYNWRTNRYLSPDEYRFDVYKDPSWRAREAKRFERGTYQALPWELPKILDHFAHVSVDNGAMVAYTPDDEKGQVDRQVRIKPGRYLKKFYPHLTSDEIRALAVLVDKACEVKFAVSGDDIEHVYLNGPNSCMAHGLDHYDSETHPVRVYGNSDLQLAYLASVSLEHEDFRASSRALVWPAKMIYGRIYGDEQRMSAALEAIGYSSGTFKGAKLTRIVEDDERLVMPYVDCCTRCEDMGDHVVLGQGNLECRETSGYVSDDRNYCQFNEERTSEDVVYIRDRGEYWSESAAQDNAFECQGCNAWFSDNHSSETIDGLTYSQYYLDDYGFYCERSHEWYLTGDTASVTLEDTNETVALSWAEQDDDAWYSETLDAWYSVKPEDAEEIEEEAKAKAEAIRVEAEERLVAPKAPGVIIEGDTVRCIRADGFSDIEEGQTYVALAVGAEYLSVRLIDGRVSGGWLHNRFVKVDAPVASEALSFAALAA